MRFLEITSFCDDDCVIDFIEPKLILPLFDYLHSIRETTSTILFSDAPQNIALAILAVYSELHPLHSHKARDSFYFDSACAIIKSSYHKPELGIEALCSELNISRATLHRCFMNSFGISPGTYIVNYRMECAKELSSHGISVKATSISCGFLDPLYFSKAFRKTYGVSPSKFSKQ
ncbi:MAG: AraC family transcriptional regulator [Acutalibacteraceae bacterium]|nr:AraC family transcriptional regulator [Acutalibacteraceae bacterium]